MTKAKKCCQFCTSLFICITEAVPHLRIKVCLHLSFVFSHFFEPDIFYTLNLILKMMCFYFSVCKISILTQNVSERDGFWILGRRPYWSNSPNPWPFGHLVGTCWKKPINDVYSAIVFFLCSTKFVQRLWIRVCSPLSVTCFSHFFWTKFFLHNDFVP